MPRLKDPAAMSIDELLAEAAELAEYEPTGPDDSMPLAKTPLLEGQMIERTYRARPHLTYLSERLSRAVRDVENRKNRHLMVSMPPRQGKSVLTSVWFAVWLLHKHPDWKIGLVSHNPTLVTSWSRQIRRVIEQYGERMGIELAHDAGAVGAWETSEGGSLTARSAPGQSMTGLGFKVLIVDDPVKNYANAHSKAEREGLENWWQGDAFTRLERPYLVIMVGTRWHENDLLGHLLDEDKKGQWEVINFPAIAEDADVLGRDPGDPLLSPFNEETREEALARWADIKEAVGSYMWEALYQGHPSPSKGAIFDADWWRFWTLDPNKVTEDGKITLLPEDIRHGRWIDSWDLTYTDKTTSDFVVGQRWVRLKADRFLIRQKRERMNFVTQVSTLEDWASLDEGVNPYGALVARVVIENAANGTAAMNLLRDKIPGLKAVNPHTAKDVRARVVTPECESGHVILPNPDEYPWVNDLLSELRAFPAGAHDDQVDALTQALSDLREGNGGSIVVPGNTEVGNRRVPTSLAAAYKSSIRR